MTEINARTEDKRVSYDKSDFNTKTKRNQSRWNTALYRDHIDSLWEEYGHSKDLKPDGFCWRSWEVVDSQ